MGYWVFKHIHVYRFTSYVFILNMLFPCELKLQLQDGQQKYSLYELNDMGKTNLWSENLMNKIYHYHGIGTP